MQRNELIEAMARAIVASHEPRDMKTRVTTARQDAQAALAAIEARGLAVVPVEPTEGMVDAGASERGFSGQYVGEVGALYAYRAMLAASPLRGEG